MSTTLSTKRKIQILRVQIDKTNGRLFSVEFRKRTDGTYRKMVCFRRAPDGVVPQGMSFDPWSKNLCPVYDIAKRDYRMIALDTVCRFKFKDTIIRFTDPNGSPVEGTIPKKDIQTKVAGTHGGVRVQMQGNDKVNTTMSLSELQYTDVALLLRRLKDVEGIGASRVRPSTLCALLEDLGVMSPPTLADM